MAAPLSAALPDSVSDLQTAQQQMRDRQPLASLASVAPVADIFQPGPASEFEEGIVASLPAEFTLDRKSLSVPSEQGVQVAVLYTNNDGAGLSLFPMNISDGIGVRAVNLNGGNIRIQGSNITGTSDEGIGVYNDALGGYVKLILSNNVSGETYGIDILNHGSGITQVDFSTVYGNTRDGILAVSYSANGGITITGIQANSQLGNAIWADNAVGGDLTINVGAAAPGRHHQGDLAKGGRDFTCRP